MSLRRVLPDTNVCFPISLLDLLLRLDEASLHEILWTEELLAELVEVWTEQGARSRPAAERVCNHVRTAFIGQDVPHRAYAPLIGQMPGDDPDDHCHAAAAAARAPATILTRNLRDFPAEQLAAFEVSVREPDDYLCELLTENRGAILEIVHQMAEDRTRPAMTPLEITDALERAGVPNFAKSVRRLLDRR